MFKSLLLAICFIALVVGYVMYLSNQADNECKVKFGKEWSGRTSTYSPSICVNEKGDVKYL